MFYLIHGATFISDDLASIVFHIMRYVSTLTHIVQAVFPLCFHILPTPGHNRHNGRAAGSNGSTHCDTKFYSSADTKFCIYNTNIYNNLALTDLHILTSFHP